MKFCDIKLLGRPTNAWRKSISDGLKTLAIVQPVLHTIILTTMWAF
jgi:hypothetical protein